MRARSSIAIHMDADGRNPEVPITVYDNYLQRRVDEGRRVELTGAWTMRKYNNPVPCGATVVLYPADDTATWEVTR